MENIEHKTPLYERHVDLGARMVSYAGYWMPVQYPDGIIAEHNAVRGQVGLFDVSHMAEALLSGPGALATLENLCTNHMATLKEGRARYSPMCFEKGGIVDDVLVYRMDGGRWLVVLNAANHQKDIQWINEHLAPETELADVSQDIAQIALQGPGAQALLEGLDETTEIPTKRYTFIQETFVAGIPCLLSRTGYTGEDGFELYTSPDRAGALWDMLLEAGAKPCGLGARDTLRLEAAMPLYGHELSPDITPMEAGLSMFVKLDKPDFIGKTELLHAGEPDRVRVGLRMAGRGIAREEARVYKDGQDIGFVTSGTLSPTLHEAIAMALLPVEYALPATRVEVDIRGRRVEADVVPIPFYQRVR